MKRISPEEHERLVNLAKRREARRVARLRRLDAAAPAALSHSSSYLNSIEFYDRRAELSRQKRRHASRPLKFPKTFSFIDQPDDATAVIEDFVARAMTRPGRMYIDQRYCTAVDLCAEAVLNAVTREAKKYYKIGFAGHFPADPEIRQIVEATGISNELGVTTDQTGDFLCHRLVKGRFDGTQAKENSMCDEESASLIDYLNQCLQRYGKKLTGAAEQRFIDLVAEVINNCEDHSGRAEWWLAAYMRQPKDRDYGDCHIAIFNFGDTIAETLQRLDDSDTTRKAIEDLVRRHNAKKSFLTGKYSHENLWTLSALQGGVSSKNPKEPGHGHRGMGTVKMLQAFMRLGAVREGGDRPVMAILSGRTHIRLDQKYGLIQRPGAEAGQQDMITFNPQSSLLERPDEAYVCPVSRFFPGTLISLRFYIDPKHLESVPDYAEDHRPS
jgi:hypothetical protein